MPVANGSNTSCLTHLLIGADCSIALACNAGEARNLLKECTPCLKGQKQQTLSLPLILAPAIGRPYLVTNPNYCPPRVAVFEVQRGDRHHRGHLYDVVTLGIIVATCTM